MSNPLKIEQTEHNTIDIGVGRGDRKALSDDLSVALADTYVLYGVTQHVHWNATGPNFYSLHKMTEAQYEDLAEAIDELAERIRAIGFSAPGGLHKMLALTRMSVVPEAHETDEMIRLLISGNETCAKSLRHAVSRAEEADDVKTADLLTERIGQHEENVWMLRASQS
jgi:starvation-inducible DNA-binding protein